MEIILDLININKNVIFVKMDQTRLNFLIKNNQVIRNNFTQTNFKNLETVLTYNQRITINNFSKINYLIFTYYINQKTDSLYDYNKNNLIQKNKKKHVKKLNLKEILWRNKSINLIYF